MEPDATIYLAVRQVPKAGEPPDTCQDAWGVGPRLRRVALADGATRALFAREWAQLLVGRFCTAENGSAPASLDPLEADTWVDPLRAEWLVLARARAEASANRPYIENRLNRKDPGAATFVGVELEPAGGAVRWRALVIGDTCLFHVTADGRWTAEPVHAAEEFDSHPQAFASVARRNVGSPARFTGELGPGELLVIATDALAKWLLEMQEPERRAAVRALLEGEFESLIASERRRRFLGASELEDDDVTLAVVSYGAAEMPGMWALSTWEGENGLPGPPPLPPPAAVQLLPPLPDAVAQPEPARAAEPVANPLPPDEAKPTNALEREPSPPPETPDPVDPDGNGPEEQASPVLPPENRAEPPVDGGRFAPIKRRGVSIWNHRGAAVTRARTAVTYARAVMPWLLLLSLAANVWQYSSAHPLQEEHQAVTPNGSGSTAVQVQDDVTVPTPLAPLKRGAVFRLAGGLQPPLTLQQSASACQAGSGNSAVQGMLGWVSSTYRGNPIVAEKGTSVTVTSSSGLRLRTEPRPANETIVVRLPTRTQMVRRHDQPVDGVRWLEVCVPGTVQG